MAGAGGPEGEPPAHRTAPDPHRGDDRRRVRSRFVIEPLEPGFGYTLGNSLRRTLLSSIPGAAVTSIRIDGILHEFTTVPGVKEDVTELILNLKELVVSSDSDEPVTMYLRKQGPGEVTAADIAPPGRRRGAQPRPAHRHAQRQGPARDRAGRRARPRLRLRPPQNKQPGQEIGRIPVDSIYSPVLKVTYAVEATRVEQRTDFDRLVVDVETKPSIEPRDAIASAGSTLVELFGLLRELNVDAEGIEVGPSPAEAADIANFSMPIEDMDLTVRSYNCLKREGVHTVGELVTRSEADLLDIRNFGAKSIDEVKMKLAAMGLALKDSPPGFIPTSVESYDEGYETDAYQGDAELRRRRVRRRLVPGDRAALTAPPAGRRVPAVRRRPGPPHWPGRSTLQHARWTTQPAHARPAA